MIKVLNLYAGIGGNRKLWTDVDVVAVENDCRIASWYEQQFKEDKVIIGDAHQYLLEHYNNFDFIWSSPPCQTHSSFRHNICVKLRGTKPEYPDMRLYQEIIFLKHHFKGKWAVENVNPYYEELMPAQKMQRHLFWTNFPIAKKEFEKDKLREAQVPDLQYKYGLYIGGSNIKNKRQVLRNCVLPELGLHIFKCAFDDEGKE